MEHGRLIFEPEKLMLARTSFRLLLYPGRYSSVHKTKTYNRYHYGHLTIPICSYYFIDNPSTYSICTLQALIDTNELAISLHMRSCLLTSFTICIPREIQLTMIKSRWTKLAELTGLSWEILKQRDHLEDTDMDGRMI